MKNYSDDAMKMLGSKVGLDKNTSKNAISSIAQLLTGKLADNASTKEGSEELLRALEKHRNGGVLNKVEDLVNDDVDTDTEGEKIVDHILGDKKENAIMSMAKNLNIDSGTIMKLLPMVAPMVMGALGKAKEEEKVDSNGLSSMLSSVSKTLSNNKGFAAMTAGLIGNQVKDSLLKKAKSAIFKKFLG